MTRAVCVAEYADGSRHGFVIDERDLIGGDASIRILARERQSDPVDARRLPEGSIVRAYRAECDAAPAYRRFVK